MIYAGWDLRWLRLLKWIMIWGDSSVFFRKLSSLYICNYIYTKISTTISIQNIYNYIYTKISTTIYLQKYLQLYVYKMSTTISIQKYLQRHIYKLFALLIVFKIQDNWKIIFYRQETKQETYLHQSSGKILWWRKNVNMYIKI